MLTNAPTTVDEIVTALQQLGGQAQAKDIKDRVTKNRGGIPPQYSRSHSYRETIQKLIEDYCPQSSNFRGTPYFERVSRGRYKLINSSASDNQRQLASLPSSHDQNVDSTSNDQKYSPITGHQNYINIVISKKEQKYTSTGSFDPNNLDDARECTIGSIVRRRGQPLFRRLLLKLYGGRCAITGSDAEQALEAAHIVPYKGEQTNTPENGLLLRADVHTLFDLRLITIDSQSMTVLVSPALKNTVYGQLQGMRLLLPNDPLKHPSKSAIDTHRRDAGF